MVGIFSYFIKGGHNAQNPQDLLSYAWVRYTKDVYDKGVYVVVLVSSVHANTRRSLKAHHGNPTFIECCLLFSGLSFSDIGEVADVFEKLISFND